MSKCQPIFFLLLFLPLLLFPQRQNIKFEHISVEDGLSQSTVMCIFQDSRGFMWFGTTDGLNKFDGYSFTVYKHDPNTPQSLAHNSIRSIYEDRLGVLWIGTRGGGLNRFDREKESFVHYKHDPENPRSLSNDVINIIYEDRFGALWIGTMHGGLNQFDRTRETFTHYKSDPKTPSRDLWGKNIFSICEDRSGVLWIGTELKGLNRFDRARTTVAHYVHDSDNPRSLSNDRVQTIYEDRSGVVWIGTFGGGLNRFDRTSETFTHYKHDPNNPRSLSHNQIMTIYEDWSGTLWIGTKGGGLNRFDRTSETFKHYTDDSNNPKSLSNNDVFSIYEDRSGVIWIGTRGGGLNRFDQTSQTFTHYQHDRNNPRSLSHNYIRAIYEDQSGVLWIGTFGEGLNRFDRATETFTHFKHDPDFAGSLSSNDVSSIQEDQLGMLWVGTRGGGLNQFDRETETFTHYQYDPNNPGSLSSNDVRAMYEDRSGVLWIGTYHWGGGLNKFDRVTKTFTQYKAGLDTLQSWSDSSFKHFNSISWITSFFEDHSGVLWMGTQGGGLNRMIRDDRGIKTHIHYGHDPNNPRSLSSNHVQSIYEDRAGVLWIGTNGGGLNRFDRTSETFKHYREKDGLPNDVVYGILEDDGGFLWLSTNKGLSKFDPQDETFKNYDVNDGLQGNEFNSGAYFKSSNGEFYFGGINGFNVFHPDSIQDNPHIPPIVITDFQVFNESVPIFKGDPSEERPDSIFLDKHISETDQIILSYKESVFSFEFAALHYALPERNQYAYMMEGFDENWNYVGTRRLATYTNLDPGDYVFRVKGSNNHGIWNEQGTSLKITILPPWWKTWWAYAIYTLLFAAALFSWRRYELNRQKLKHSLELEQVEAEKLKEVDRMKSRFFANISHEFRTPLTLILGPVQQLLSGEFKGNMAEQYQRILRNAERLLRLVNQLLDISRLEAGKMKLQTRPENIVELTRQLTMAFESLASVHDIELQFIAPDEPLTVYLEREHYEKIITNLLSNALKFTPKGGKVKVGVTIPGRGDRAGRPYDASTKAVEITVIDTGPGIPAEHLPHIFDRFYQAGDSYVKDTQGSGIGLALAKELVELHHGTIEVFSEAGKGTEFTIRLPLGKDHLKAEEIADKSRDADAEITPLSPPLVRGEERGGEVVDTIDQPSKDSKSAPILLIVEDNPDMRAYIREILVESYKVIEASDGQEGWERALESMPDLIISDMMMPKMDGAQLCNKLKSDERTGHIPVILLTAKAGEESKIEGLETGADDYLTKPFDAAELQIRAKNLVEQRQKLREKFRREFTVQPGDVAASRYKILQRIGEGGMGEVYLAEDSELKRKAALKFLTHHPTEEKARLRFQREAQAAAALNHPNIITVYEVGEYNERAYIAMEYIEGHSLRELLDNAGTVGAKHSRQAIFFEQEDVARNASTLQIDQIIEIPLQICEGLASAHRAGIVHRDLKPANIMIDVEGRVKILDFGLAKLKGADKLTKTETTLGTMSYMSPEQFRSDEVDQRSDIWSLGVIMYEMLAGQNPFKGDHYAAVMYEVLSIEPEPLRKWQPEVGVELERIVNKALRKEKGERYQTMEALLVDLQAL